MWKFLNKPIPLWWVLIVLLFLAITGCTTVRPCANVATNSTLWQVGLSSNKEDYSCNEGLDDDLLDPDVYTDIENKWNL